MACRSTQQGLGEFTRKVRNGQRICGSHESSYRVFSAGSAELARMPGLRAVPAIHESAFLCTGCRDQQNPYSVWLQKMVASSLFQFVTLLALVITVVQGLGALRCDVYVDSISGVDGPRSTMNVTPAIPWKR